MALSRGNTAEAVMTWLIMTWGSAQAGDRTSKTERCLQWWDSRPEWGADASGADNLRDWQLLPMSRNMPA